MTEVTAYRSLLKVPAFSLRWHVPAPRSCGVRRAPAVAPVLLIVIAAFCPSGAAGKQAATDRTAGLRKTLLAEYARMDAAIYRRDRHALEN
ncbi:MAG: hypothetical protein LC772_06070, partial [Chloroflexi bacterium]|nr:hypothetical protein [Chloroflexota bacterium]